MIPAVKEALAIYASGFGIAVMILYGQWAFRARRHPGSLDMLLVGVLLITAATIVASATDVIIWLDIFGEWEDELFGIVRPYIRVVIILGMWAWACAWINTAATDAESVRRRWRKAGVLALIMFPVLVYFLKLVRP